MAGYYVVQKKMYIANSLKMNRTWSDNPY